MALDGQVDVGIGRETVGVDTGAEEDDAAGAEVGFKSVGRLADASEQGIASTRELVWLGGPPDLSGRACLGGDSGSLRRHRGWSS